MAVSTEERKTIIPTLVIGVGGTGVEVMSRLRRLVVESYESLDNLPILSFMHIDTDQNYKLSNQTMAGPALENNERYWSRVNEASARRITENIKEYPWFEDWVPPEMLNRPNLLASEEGAGQIRACGRFSFFFNSEEIQKACVAARRKIRGHDKLMEERYGLKVLPQLNIFLLGSISGGTGSGMLIDLGYCLRKWFAGEPALEVTAIIPSPDAFGGISGDLRIKANGYAALMELNYYSDVNTQFSVRYGSTEASRVEDRRPPFDYTYLVGTNNEQGVELKLDDIREMMAQNIFLDLVSDYSPYKRSIRDNIKRQIGGQNDTPPQGRSYPRNFMSFGLAAIEIPIFHIQNTLSARLTADLFQWWQNAHVSLPPEPLEAVRSELQSLRLLGKDIHDAVLRAGDRPYPAVVAEWVNSIRTEIADGDRLECTQQGLKVIGSESGKILTFVDGYLRPKVDQYIADHLRDTSPEERNHGDYLTKMYDNRQEILRVAALGLQEKMYSYLTDRNRGPKYLETMLNLMERQFTSDAEQFERLAIKSFGPVEETRFKEYNTAITRINDFRNRYGVTKQDDMGEDAADALEALGNGLTARLERKCYMISVSVLRRLIEMLGRLRSQLNRWTLRITQSEARFRELANQEANQADALSLVGIKLFKRDELNELYSDFLRFKVGGDEGNLVSAEKRGLNLLCEQITAQILIAASPLWQEFRPADVPFRLLDLEALEEQIRYPDFEKIMIQKAQVEVKSPSQESKLHVDTDASTRFMKLYTTEQQQEAQIELLFNRSQPLIRLDRTIPQNSNFRYLKVPRAGILGGERSTFPAAQRQVQLLKKYFSSEDAVAPLTARERHKILAVQEVGGFSLRCISGMEILRESYQKWRGERVKAERERLKGNMMDLPIPVHLQKEMVFWDFIPARPEIEKLVLVCRCLDILRNEVNQRTGQSVICYQRMVDGHEEKIILAATWEDAVVVLQVPDCRADRLEVERQLAILLEAVETAEQRSAIRQKLEQYLTQRLQEFRRLGGEDNPIYLRERTFIREFIRGQKLGVITEPAPVAEPAPTPGPVLPLAAQQLEQYLSQLVTMGVPADALEVSAQAKAIDLQLEPRVTAAILSKFIAMEPSAQELELERYLDQLKTLGVPKEALRMAGQAKATELQVTPAKADALLAKWVG